MRGTGMSPYTLAHYNRVARNMNNYVAASAHNFYPGYDNFYPGYDRAAMGGYQTMFDPYASLGNRFANRLYSAGLPNSVVNLGYHVGGLFDGYL